MFKFDPVSSFKSVMNLGKHYGAGGINFPSKKRKRSQSFSSVPSQTLNVTNISPMKRSRSVSRNRGRKSSKPDSFGSSSTIVTTPLHRLRPSVKTPLICHTHLKNAISTSTSGRYGFKVDMASTLVDCWTMMAMCVKHQNGGAYNAQPFIGERDIVDSGIDVNGNISVNPFAYYSNVFGKRFKFNTTCYWEMTNLANHVVEIDIFWCTVRGKFPVPTAVVLEELIKTDDLTPTVNVEQNPSSPSLVLSRNIVDYNSTLVDFRNGDNWKNYFKTKFCKHLLLQPGEIRKFKSLSSFNFNIVDGSDILHNATYNDCVVRSVGGFFLLRHKGALAQIHLTDAASATAMSISASKIGWTRREVHHCLAPVVKQGAKTKKAFTFYSQDDLVSNPIGAMTEFENVESDEKTAYIELV